MVARRSELAGMGLGHRSSGPDSRGDVLRLPTGHGVVSVKKREGGKRSKTKQPKSSAFLAAYAKVGNISQASKIAGVERKYHYVWMKDPAYREQFDAAHTEACEHLEAEARRRAVEGYKRPVFHQGQVCGTVQEYSDVLLIFLMKGAMPEKYREKFSYDSRSSVRIEADVQVVNELRVAMLADKDFHEFIRQRAIAEYEHASGVCDDGESRALENGSASGDGRPSSNGHSNGKH